MTNSPQEAFKEVAFHCRLATKEGQLPTFPVDPTHSQDTAKDWASFKSYRYGPSPSPGECFIYPNTFHRVQLVDLVVRNEGGRAFKVLIHHDDKQFLVDFREYELLDVIQEEGISKGGWLNGTFSFVRAGSQTKLTRVGSKTYLDFFKQQEKNAQSRIKLKDLQPFHIYKGKDENHKYLYLGEVFVPSFTVERLSGHYYIPSIKANIKAAKKSRLFISWSRYGRENQSEELLIDMALTGKLPKDSYTGFKYTVDSSPNLYEDLAIVSCSSTLEQLITFTHEAAAALYKDLLPKVVERGGGGRYRYKETLYAYPSQVEHFIATACSSSSSAGSCQLLTDLWPQLEALSQ